MVRIARLRARNEGWHQKSKEALENVANVEMLPIPIPNSQLGIGNIGNWQHWQHWQHWQTSSIHQQLLGGDDEIEVAICGDTFRKLARIDKRR